MAKELPKVYANKIDRTINNNEKVYYGKNEQKEVKETREANDKNDVFSLNQKINKIFGSSRYVYKADVDITLNDDSTISKKVIGRNKNELITMDNELIKISDIKDIKFSEN